MSESTGSRIISKVMALEAIRQNPLTLIVVDRFGHICELQVLNEFPGESEILAVGKRHRGEGGCGYRFLEKREMTQAELERIIQRLVEGIELNRSGKLKPGANLIDKQGNLEWAQDAARRRLKKLRGYKRPPP